MIQLAALPAQVATVEIAQNPGNPAGKADFSALLAPAGAPAGTAPPVPPLTPADPAAGAPRQAPADAASEGGKILPLALAGAAVPAATGAADIAAQARPAPEAAEEPAQLTAALVASPAPARVEAKPQAAAKPARAKDAPPSDDDRTDDAAARLALIGFEPAVTVAVNPLVPNASASAPSAPAQATADTSAAPREMAPAASLPPAIAAQLQGMPLPTERANRLAAPAERPAENELAENEPAPAAERLRLVPVTALRPDLAPAASALRLGDTSARPGTPAGALKLVVASPERETGSKAPALSLAPDAPAFPQPAAAASVSPEVAAGTPAPAAPAPHDFAALVDRLIEARDAARPHGVSLSLDHAEFGAVSLHFRHEAGGLSVSASSADPAFARAVEAAIPPAAAAAAGTGAGSQYSSSPSGGRAQDGGNVMPAGQFGSGQFASGHTGTGAGGNGGGQGPTRLNNVADAALMPTPTDEISDGAPLVRAGGHGRFA